MAHARIVFNADEANPTSADLFSPLPLSTRPVSTPQFDYGWSRVPGMASDQNAPSVDALCQPQPTVYAPFKHGDAGGDGCGKGGVSRKRPRPSSLLGLSMPVLPSELYSKRYCQEEQEEQREKEHDKQVDVDALLAQPVRREL